MKLLIVLLTLTLVHSVLAKKIILVFGKEGPTKNSIISMLSKATANATVTDLEPNAKVFIDLPNKEHHRVEDTKIRPVDVIDVPELVFAEGSEMAKLTSVFFQTLLNKTKQVKLVCSITVDGHNKTKIEYKKLLKGLVRIFPDGKKVNNSVLLIVTVNGGQSATEMKKMFEEFSTKASEEGMSGILLKHFIIKKNDEIKMVQELRKNLGNITFVPLVSGDIPRIENLKDDNDGSFPPQDPISGTLLSTNTLYHIHDAKRPTCFVVAHLIDHFFPGVACSKADKTFYNRNNSLFVIESYGGGHSIRSLHSNIRRYLTPCLISSSVCSWYERPDKFYFIQDPENPSRVSLYHNESRSSNGPVEIIIGDQFPDFRSWLETQKLNTPTFPFTFLPSITLNAYASRFDIARPSLEQLEANKSQKDLIVSYTIDNPSPATIEETIIVSKEIEEKFTFGFEESLKIIHKITGKLAIPGGPEFGSETGIEINLSANQQWTTTTKKSFMLSQKVTVPPHSSVRVSGYYELVEGVTVPYTAEANVTGVSRRLTNFDDLVDDQKVSGTIVRQEMQRQKFEGKVKKISSESVTISIAGMMTAALGFNGHISVVGGGARKVFKMKEVY